ncbi:MAG: DUF1902 domain-containing protein [Alphaproteobacteria bacterium]
MELIRIKMMWDAEAKVFCASSEDVPGLVAEAASMDEMLAQLDILVPDLLEDNKHLLNAPQGRNTPMCIMPEPFMHAAR